MLGQTQDSGAQANPPQDGPEKAAAGVRVLRLVIWCALAAVVGGLPLASVLQQRYLAEHLLAQESRLAGADIEVINSRRLVHDEEELPARTTISQYLEKAGLDTATVGEIVRDARPIYNLARVRAGNHVDIIRSGKGDLRAVSYQVDEDRVLWLTKQGKAFTVELQPVPYTVTVAGVAGTVRDSLFQAMADEDEGDWLTLKIADIFGWDVDFSTDTQPGDTFEIVVEKKMLGGQLWGYGRVLAAQYQNEGRLHQAVLFRDPSGRLAYYGPSGKSLQKAFLRSPLKFSAPVTSRFSRSRFHPILKRYRPHLGVDYGAPVGSPVQAVGDGRVVSTGWNGGGGNMVRLRHPMGYETYYLHLSSLLVRPGQQVQQGQVIARTGATGLATGPHLDFRVTRHGSFVNFLRLELPPAQSVAQKDWNDFVATRTELLDQLASLHTQPSGTLAEARSPAPDQQTTKGN
ncbi:MAG: peptidoglycan DD-metalloendopeptidase family protein [Acidobacteriia bacterium]|nr:peptidoglycan DD-metalloendopeptidase family protein [Terriglobia bacterium]